MDELTPATGLLNDSQQAETHGTVTYTAYIADPPLRPAPGHRRGQYEPRKPRFRTTGKCRCGIWLTGKKPHCRKCGPALAITRIDPSNESPAPEPDPHAADAQFVRGLTQRLLINAGRRAGVKVVPSSDPEKGLALAPQADLRLDYSGVPQGEPDAGSA